MRGRGSARGVRESPKSRRRGGTTTHEAAERLSSLSRRLRSSFMRSSQVSCSSQMAWMRSRKCGSRARPLRTGTLSANETAERSRVRVGVAAGGSAGVAGRAVRLERRASSWCCGGAAEGGADEGAAAAAEGGAEPSWACRRVARRLSRSVWSMLGEGVDLASEPTAESSSSSSSLARRSRSLFTHAALLLCGARNLLARALASCHTLLSLFSQRAKHVQPPPLLALRLAPLTCSQSYFWRTALAVGSQGRPLVSAGPAQRSSDRLCLAPHGRGAPSPRPTLSHERALLLRAALSSSRTVHKPRRQASSHP